LSTDWTPSRPGVRDWSWLGRELDSLHKGLETAAPHHQWQTKTAAPARASAGMVVNADASNWNPGDTGINWTQVNDAGLFVRNQDNTAWTPIYTGVNRRKWASSALTGAHWAARDSELFVMSAVGHEGISGAARTSLQDNPAYAAIGTGGYLWNDGSATKGWAFYADVQHEDGATWSAALEMAIKNKSSTNNVRNPYIHHSGLFGLWIYGGGDDAYGGSTVSPTTAGIVFVKPQYAGNEFNTGICFDSDALVMHSGLGRAMHLGQNQGIVWAAAGFLPVVASIYSAITLDRDYRVVYTNDGIDLAGTSAAPIIRATHATSGVNYVQVTNAATTVNPLIAAAGETNSGLSVSSNGTGSVFMQTNAGNAVQAEFAHVASSVNWWEFKGSTAATATVQLNINGSTATVSALYSTKGGGNHRFATGGGFNDEQVRIVHTASSVNQLQLTGSATTNPIALTAIGTDANIDLRLVPKGTGVVRFGTYTAGAVAQAGYITVKDSGGTTRRLLVG
jgi:hypothetical protein